MSNPIIELQSAVVDPWHAPDLSYLGSGRRAAPHFPLPVLGPFWADYVDRSAKGSSAAPDYVATSLLAAVSALIANVRWPHAGSSWREAPVLWFCNVGSPGSGKSPAVDPVLDLLQHVESLLATDFEEELSEYELDREIAEAAHSDWRSRVRAALTNGDDPPPAPPPPPREPERPRVRVSDATIEKLAALAAALPRGLLLQRDEIAGWLGTFDRYGGGGADRAFWLEAYGGRSYLVDRVKHKEPLRVPHLSIAVLGGIQPDKLPKIISGAEDGFAARFLFAWPEVQPSFRLAREIRDENAARNALARLIELNMIAEGDDLGPRRVQLDQEAEDYLEEFGQEMAPLAHEATGPMAHAYAKARGFALRLSAVIEHLWWCGGETGTAEPENIGHPAVSAATRLLREYFIPMAERVYGDASIPQGDRLAMTLARHLRCNRLRAFNGRLLRREIGGMLRRPEDMAQACDVLEQAGFVRQPARAEGVRGRPGLDYEVNPVIWQVSGPDSGSQPARTTPTNVAKKANTPQPSLHFGTFDTFGTAICSDDEGYSDPARESPATGRHSGSEPEGEQVP